MTDKALRNAIVRTNFHAFMTMSFITLRPNTEFKDNWHLEVITRHLEQVRQGNIKRLIINVPPRSLKSLITSVALPAFLLGHEPGARILCVSHSSDLASQFGRECRLIMESDWYRSLFPGTVLKKMTEDVLETEAGGRRRAASIEAGITGHGGGYILIDDPLDASDAPSAAAREKVIRTYKNSILQRLDDKLNDRIVLVMQRLHEEDLSGILKVDPEFKSLVLPATAVSDETHELWNGSNHVRKAGELLHPEREPQSVLDEMQRQMSAAGYTAQYQEDPVPDGGEMLKPDWIKRYDRKPNRAGMRIVISVDTAIKGMPEANYSVATVWGEREGYHYLLDEYRKKVHLPQLVEDVAQLCAKYQPDMVLIEEQGSGVGLMAYLKEQHGIIALGRRPKLDKESRFSHATLYFEKGQVLFPRDAPWLLELERELLQFPSSVNDDQVDSVSQYLNWDHERPQGFTVHWLDRDVEDSTVGTIADMLASGWRPSPDFSFGFPPR